MCGGVILWTKYSYKMTLSHSIFRGRKKCSRECRLSSITEELPASTGDTGTARTAQELPGQPPAQKNCGGRGDGGLFSRLVFIVPGSEISAFSAAASPPPICRSHYEIDAAEMASNASEECKTISGSLS